MDGLSDKYITLGKAASAELTERKSVFLSHASPVKTEDEAIAFIRSAREKYPDASHNVYAYLIGRNITRYSDDGEPSGTAGLPVFDVIRKGGFCDAVIVVTRYFGGILLGAGGLVRAYSSAAAAAVAAAGIAEYEPYREFTLTCGYSDYGKIEYELPKYEVKRDGIEYGAEVILKLAVPERLFDTFSSRTADITAGRASLSPAGSRYDN